MHIFEYVVTTVNFNQSTYSVNENSGYIYPVLVLSKPYSVNFYVRITAGSVTARGELFLLTAYKLLTYL